MSYSIRFEDGNSVGFIGWNYGGIGACVVISNADKA